MDPIKDNEMPKEVKELLAERKAAREAEEERERQEEAAAYEEGWKVIFEYLNKLKDTMLTSILLRKDDTPVDAWFDNAASLVERYNASKFETMRDTFISTIQSIEDENDRIYIASRMQFVFKLTTLKIAPMDYVKAVYAFRTFSEQIGSVLGNSPRATVQVVEMWKDTVYVRHAGGPVKNILDIFKKTWFEKMIEDIKALDPKYEAPKFRLGLIAGDCGDK